MTHFVRRTTTRNAYIALLLSYLTAAQASPASTDQLTGNSVPGTFLAIPDTIVSAQQLFLGQIDKLYILDKVENNPTQINGHPTWASEYRLSDNSQRPMDVVTNTFCAGGNVLGNGTWVNVGGNQAVTSSGAPARTQDGSSGPYYDADGRQSIRLLNPCSGNDCQWYLSSSVIDQRWYPTVETLQDGSAIILGGCRNGGYVNDASQTNPTFEYFPPRGPPVQSNILQTTLPANLYPLTWLLPSGKLLVQATWSTVLLDPNTHAETPLDDMPDAVRTYPASAGTVMMPLAPYNNWTATIMFCGGSNIKTTQWTDPDFVVVSQPASNSCVKITPDVSPSYVNDDPLPVQRSMVSCVLLPDGKVLCLNGARMGTAGYGTNNWAIGQSYADDPVLTPVMYDPAAPAGERWSSEGFSASVIPRMYHSTALLLPDGSIFVSGSNPNKDYISGPQVKYPTEYRTERFFPPYYNQRRPQPKGLLEKLTYGGDPFNVVLDNDDLFNNVNNVQNASVAIIRPGFSTHAMSMGQRMVILESTYTGYENNTAVLHVSQVPPNPAVLAPGPALLFVVVKGVPSIGVEVMIGSGAIEEQKVLPVGLMPTSSIVANDTSVATTPDAPPGAGGGPSAKAKQSAGYSAFSDLPALWLHVSVSLTLLATCAMTGLGL